jgi:hypothetical protein
LKQVIIILAVLFSLLSCNRSEDTLSNVTVKKQSRISDFGFTLSDYNVVNDTIKSGDTFGSIIQKQNIGDKKVYDIVAQVKDTFDVRTIRISKPYTLLRSKNKTNTLSVFIYQPDALHYYVVDLRDSIAVAHKKTKPLTLKRRTIGGLLKGSLSETLEGAKVEGALASRFQKYLRGQSISLN